MDGPTGRRAVWTARHGAASARCNAGRLNNGASARQEPLYADDCCEVVHPDCVKIFWYYFPLAGTKTVQVSDLKCASTQHQRRASHS
jgi:hypothetical protein